MKGEEYSRLREVVFVAITNFEMFPGKRGVKSDHVILDKQTREHDLRDLYFTFIELPKFQKGVDELDTLTEKWYYYLRHASETTKEEYERLVEGAPMLRRAYDELERCSWREVELNTYEQIRKRALDNAAALHCKLQEGMAMGEERGVKKGKQEGIAIGEEKGIAIGKEEGREERNIEIAKNMLSRKLSVVLIAGVTGLSLEQISELK